jgi:PAS domain S-box-containing protein
MGSSFLKTGLQKLRRKLARKQSPAPRAAPRPMPMSVSTKALDMLPLGIVKVAPNESFTYANKTMLRLAGTETWEGLRIRDVFPDEETYQKVSEHLKRRLTVEPAAAYDIDLTRRDGSKVPIQVSGIQDLDIKRRPIGAVAIVRDLTVQRAAERIHKTIARERDRALVLASLVKEIEQLMHFDMVFLSLFSADGLRVRQLHSNVEAFTDTRWHEMCPAEIENYRAQPMEVGDPVDILERPEWSHRKSDPTTQEFLTMGFRSSLRYTVFREGNPVGALNLFSKTAGAYTNADLALIKALPISEALLMTVHYEEVQHLRFVLELVSELSSVGSDITTVAQTLARRIGEHYGWQHVSIFRVDEDRQELRVLSQWSTGKYGTTDAGGLPLDQGLLGYAYRNQCVINVGDVETSTEFKDIYHRTFPNTRSELCLPVNVQGKVNWLINLEDSRKNAFVHEEEQQLKVIFQQVVQLLERAWSEHYITAVFRAARDALILTSDDGIIKAANPAALDLLGYAANDGEALLGRSLTEYIGNKLVCKHYLHAESVAADEVTLQPRSGEPISALVSSASLPPEIGGKIIVASDLSWRRRVERLESLRKIYHELATQTKPSLSLVSTWLKRLDSRPSSEWPDTIAKTLRQLSRLDLTFTRLMLYDRDGQAIPYHERQWELPHIVESVLERLPKQEASVVRVETDGNPAPIVGDYFQLVFCVESVLSYLSRLLPQDGAIQLRIFPTTRTTALTFGAPVPDSVVDGTGAPSNADPWLERSLGEMALGLQTVRTMVRRNHGRCFRPKLARGRLTYRFDFRATPQR